MIDNILREVILEMQPGDRIRVNGKWIPVEIKDNELYEMKYGGVDIQAIQLFRHQGHDTYHIEVRRAI